MDCHLRLLSFLSFSGQKKLGSKWMNCDASVIAFRNDYLNIMSCPFQQTVGSMPSHEEDASVACGSSCDSGGKVYKAEIIPVACLHRWIPPDCIEIESLWRAFMLSLSCSVLLMICHVYFIVVNWNENNVFGESWIVKVVLHTVT